MHTTKIKALANLDDIQGRFLANKFHASVTVILFPWHKPFMGSMVIMGCPQTCMLKPTPQLMLLGDGAFGK